MIFKWQEHLLWNKYKYKQNSEGKHTFCVVIIDPRDATYQDNNHCTKDNVSKPHAARKRLK